MTVLKIYLTKAFQIINKKHLFFFLALCCSFFFCYLFKFFFVKNKQIEVIKKASISSPTKKKNFLPFFSIPTHNEHQFLEKLALKEQIEEDLKLFDFIDNVRVGFSTNQNTQEYSKLSLIISPNIKFNEQTYIKLKSIVDYLCSIVNNLSPEKISISDKEGNFYNTEEIFSLCAHDTQNVLYKKEFSLELDTYIQKILPKKHYFFLLNISGKEQKKAFIDININKEYFNLLSSTQQEQLFLNISSLIKRLFTNKNILTDIIFHQSQFLTDHMKLSFKQKVVIASIYLLASCIVILSSYIYLLSQNFQKNVYDLKRKNANKYYLNQLTNFIKTEKPHRVADMLKYLDKEKINQILKSLDERTQKEINDILRNHK